MTSGIPVLCICGPTGTGKTGASLALAGELNGAVVNFDSRQVYEDFPIITAQPSPGERAVCSHLLYGFLPTSDRLTAGAWARMAAREIDSLHARGRLPILVGGTGFYLRALLRPLSPIPDVPEAVRSEVLARLAGEGSEKLHAELQSIDPRAAERIHPNDSQRVSRALEVHAATGRPLSEWQDAPGEKPPYEPCKLGLAMEAEDLGKRLAVRIEAMLAMGAVEEAERAWERCPDPHAPGWSGIGCAELLAYIRGEIDLEEGKDLWLRNTRAYAKRQLTWFRKEPGMRWFEPGRVQEMLRAAKEFLARD